MQTLTTNSLLITTFHHDDRIALPAPKCFLTLAKQSSFQSSIKYQSKVTQSFTTIKLIEI